MQPARFILLFANAFDDEDVSAPPAGPYDSRAYAMPSFGHKRAGLPVVIYQNGKTVWVDPDDLDLE